MIDVSSSLHHPNVMTLLAAFIMVFFILSKTTSSFLHQQELRSSQISNVRRHYYSRRYLIPSSSDLITSTKSNTVKKIQHLLNKRKKRNELGQVVVEGPRMVTDLLRCNETASLVRQIIVDCDKYDDFYATELEDIISFNMSKHSESNNASLPRWPPQILLATPQVLQACTDTVTNQGIVALVDIPNYNQKLLVERSKTSNAFSSTLLYLVLDEVQDPGNLGTLIRSARATGVAATLLLPGSADPFNPKAVRSAMGTTFSLPVLQLKSWEDCCRLLHEVGCQQIWAATMLEEKKNDSDSTANTGTLDSTDRNKEYYQVNWMAQPVSALIIGSEGNGLTLPVRASLEQGHVQIDDKTRLPINAVHIPMQAGLESLNAAVCGSVILFEYQRQRQVAIRTTR